MTPIEVKVRELLAEVMAPGDVEIWLRSSNASFRGKSAREMFDSGLGETVLRRAEFLVGWAR